MATGYGDASIFFNTPEVRRQDLTNAAAHKLTVFPGDLINNDRPNEPFTLAWVDNSDQDMIDDYADSDYVFVTEDRFVAHRWRWDQGKLCAGANLVLMYKPYLDAVQSEERRRDLLQKRLDGATEEFHNMAAAEGVKGVSSFESKHGERTVFDGGKKRK